MRFLYVILWPMAMIAVVCITIMVFIVDILLRAIGVDFIPSDAANVLFKRGYDRGMPERRDA